MTVQASKNTTMINRILDGIKSKLDLLAREDEECPICLDKGDNMSSPVVLGCCHKVCKECWEQWKQVSSRW